jgi:hypothetical protein
MEWMVVGDCALMWNDDGLGKSEVLGRGKPASMPIYPRQIPHSLPWIDSVPLR